MHYSDDIQIDSATIGYTRPIARRPSARRDDRVAPRITLVLALGVALVGLVLALAQVRGAAPVAPDDVAAILFQNG